jgi:FkbM family methyltransferase
MIERISTHLRRTLNARRFGVPFTRRASFVMPTRVRLRHRCVPLVFPPEQGAYSDFLACFINDEYGLREVAGPVHTIVDIGANVGFFSMAAQAYFPHARIHAYEPNPRVLQYTTTNAASAGFSVFAEAVGGSAGFVSIEDCGDSNLARTVSMPDAAPTIPQVAVATIVQRLGGCVDLVKIDCEGAEWELFSDDVPWLGVKHLRMEYHLGDERTYTDVKHNLSRIGFAIHHHQPCGSFGTVWARRIKP